MLSVFNTLALNYNKIKNKDLRKYQNLNGAIWIYISKYNWEGIEFPAGPKDWGSLKKIMRQLVSIYYMYHPRKKK